MGWAIYVPGDTKPRIERWPQPDVSPQLQLQPKRRRPWRPRKPGAWISHGQLTNHRIGRPQRRPRRPPFAILHSTESSASAGFEFYSKWAQRQDDRWSGYHVAVALDLPAPLLLADPRRFRTNHAGPWNAGLGIAVVMRVGDWPGLSAEQRAHLAGGVLDVLRRYRCSSDAVIDGVRVSDRRLLRTDDNGDPELPPLGTFVAHDWCVTSSRGDVKSDPAEPLIAELCRIRRETHIPPVR